MHTEHKPLPARVRPHDFDKIVGQKKIWGEGAPLRALAENDAYHSLLFWGPPGTGKTTVANALGASSGHPLRMLSAVHAGVADLRKTIQESEARIEMGQGSLLLFLDEIHRLKKNQQDVLLPALEEGVVKFIGATTENPSFEVNNAILSRSMIFRFESLSQEELITLVNNALTNPDANLGQIEISQDVKAIIADSSAGDGRKCLNILEALVSCLPHDITKVETEHLDGLHASFQLKYDKKGDHHYDTISAFIKSIRASHPDAALHYLATMIEGGEDPVFIARRLVIAASEDIGNANPTALMLATSCMQAVGMVGMPEARIILGQTTTYLAGSIKSNRSYVAIDQALDDVRKFKDLEIPLHLRNAPTKLMKEMGYGKNYAYPHDSLQEARQLPYLPDKLKGAKYYHPKELGVEKQILATLRYLRPTED